MVKCKKIYHALEIQMCAMNMTTILRKLGTIEYTCFVKRYVLPSKQFWMKRTGWIVISVVIAPIYSKFVEQSIQVCVPEFGCVMALNIQHSMNSV